MAAGSPAKVVLAALGTNAGLAAAKFAAAAFTGSSAMLSEAIHSLVAAANQALMLHGWQHAARAAGSSQPTGPTRELYFWSFVVAILLFSMGSGIAIYEGWAKLANPRPIANPEVACIVLAIAIVMKVATAVFASREYDKIRNKLDFVQALRASKDPSVFAVLIQELAALAGLLIALAGIMIAQFGGIQPADGVASIVIGVILAAVAASAAIEVKTALTGPVPQARNEPVTEKAAPIQAPSVQPGTDTMQSDHGTTPLPQADQGGDTDQRNPPAPGKPRIVSRPPHARKGRGKRKR
ncbi:MAG: cation diffusion facilitator family transporter [Hyphomicrobiales bacterium]